MIESSKNNRGIIRKNTFERKKKKPAGLSFNRPSNNWAMISNSQVASPCKTNLDTTQATISLENRPFDGKRATKMTSAGTPHTEAQYKRETKSTVCTENFPEFFHTLESLHQAFKTQEKVLYRIYK